MSDERADNSYDFLYLKGILHVSVHAILNIIFRNARRARVYVCVCARACVYVSLCVTEKERENGGGEYVIPMSNQEERISKLGED